MARLWEMVVECGEMCRNKCEIIGIRYVLA